MILEKKVHNKNDFQYNYFFFQSITIHSFSLMSFFLLTRDRVWLFWLKNDLISPHGTSLDFLFGIFLAGGFGMSWGSSIMLRVTGTRNLNSQFLVLDAFLKIPKFKNREI